MMMTRGVAVSLLFHGLLYFGGVGYLAWKNSLAGPVVEVDLTHSSLLNRPRTTVGRPRALPLEPWCVTTGKRTMPAPLKQTVAAPVAAPEEQTTAAETPAGNGGVPGETWLPAAAAAHIPEWVEGLITEEDYPPAARKQGKESRVVVAVAIDATGQVRGLEITEGSDPEFNELVVKRLKDARFRPARDQNGNPIAVRMSIPIVFELD